MKARLTVLGMMKLFYAGVTLLLFTSCFKQDTPVVLPPPGEEKSFTVAMGEDYHRQVYFDFNTTDTAGSEHTSWDLCFESTDTGYHIWMNGANTSFIANTDTQEFAAVTDTAGAKWMMDNANWNIDSTAVGDWRVNRMVYIIDRGPAKSSADRYRKIIFQSVDAFKYEIQFSNLDGSNFSILDVNKKPGNAFVYFTFDNNGQPLDIEPAANSWDVIFTRYRTIFYDIYPPLPYVVTGVLINPNVAVAVDSAIDFSSIDYQKALTMTFSTQRDIVGYKWKQFDFSTQAYTVKPYINYVIRDMEGVYWKMHFIDFYNAQGQKGYPQFEYQRL